jgi:hypothetical protein
MIEKNVPAPIPAPILTPTPALATPAPPVKREVIDMGYEFGAFFAAVLGYFIGYVILLAASFLVGLLFQQILSWLNPTNAKNLASILQSLGFWISLGMAYLLGLWSYSCGEAALKMLVGRVGGYKVHTLKTFTFCLCVIAFVMDLLWAKGFSPVGMWPLLVMLGAIYKSGHAEI